MAAAESNDATCIDVPVIEPEVEIKEGPGWIQTSSKTRSHLSSYNNSVSPRAEVTREVAASCVTGTDKDVPTAPRRFCSEVFSCDGNKASYSAFIADAEGKGGPEKPHVPELHLNILREYYAQWQNYLQSLKSIKPTEFSSNSSSEVHMKNNSVVDKRPHKCEICDRSFILLAHLKRHRSTHEGKKPYSCDTCGKCFTRDSCLRKHKLLHEGKRPHKCDICNMSFAQLSYLKAHSLTHDGKRPHKCVICGRSFTRMAELKRHNKLVHEKKQLTGGNVEAVINASLKSTT